MAYYPIDRLNPNGNAENNTEKVILAALDTLGVYYNVTRDLKSFKEAMRSGIYNTYLLTGNEPVIDHVDDELIERVNFGEGLIFVKYEVMEPEKFKRITGVKTIGSLPAKVRVVDVLDNAVMASDDITAYGKVQKFEVNSANAITLARIYEQNNAYPAITLNQYGKGYVIAIGVDVGESARYMNSGVAYSNMLRALINYIAPKEMVVLPGYPLAIEAGFKSFGASFDLRVKEEIQTDGVLLTYPRVNPNDSDITWEFTLFGNSEQKLLYITKPFESGGTYRNITTVEYLKDGAYEVYDAYPVEINAENIIDLEMRILSGLQTLPGASVLVNQYQSIINAPSGTKQDIQKKIQDIIGVIDGLNKLGSTAAAVRLDMDSLLKIFERQWMEVSAE